MTNWAPPAPPADVATQVSEVALWLAASTTSPDVRDHARHVVARLEGPLRVAIAGRVKAGKSTLLNALVGERLAATDAGECTRLVSVFRRGPSYEVTAQLRDGRSVPLTFDRSLGGLDIALGGTPETDVEFIDVAWPTTSLDRITLIDTPGLASVNDENSRRTRDFLEADPNRASDADAIIYLLRHAHRGDVAFLDAFMDRSVTGASPVNAVAVLSRADEIGAGRPDVMQSAERIANRYRADPQLTGLVGNVVPLAGLLAETGLTLREEEVAALRLLARTDAQTLGTMLVSVDQFCDVSSSDLTVEARRDLLARFGMFGVRLAVRAVQEGSATNAATLGEILVEASGLRALQALLVGQFGPRARVLQARTALMALRAIARNGLAGEPHVAAELDRRLEHIESGALQFVQVRAQHLVASGAARLTATERAEMNRVLDEKGTAARLGLPADAAPGTVTAAVLDAISRWRTSAADPLADPATAEVCDVMARSLEEMYARHIPPAS